MTCHQDELELGDYVDGALPPSRRAAVEAHLAACPECHALVADLTVIQQSARTLAPQLPSPAVWEHLAAAVARDQRQPWWRLATGAFAWRPIAAAAVMVALLSGGTWLAWRDASGSRPGRTAASADRATPASAIESLSAGVQLAEQHYTTAIGDLEQVTQSQSGSLDPEVARVVQANLAVIDDAIGQSRAALRSQPASTVAQESLFDALRSKVQLLQDTVALINEMRKGNPEGAARIISDMKP